MATLLERLKAAADAKRHRTVRWPVPDDATLVLTLRVPTDGLEVDRLRGAAERAHAGKAVGVAVARATLAQCCERIEFEGETAVDEETGEPLTFRSPALWAAHDTRTASETVPAVLGGDGPVTALFARLMQEARYFDPDAVDTDPL